MQDAGSSNVPPVPQEGRPALRLVRWIPRPYRDELVQVLRLTGPLVVSRILQFLLPFATTMFCGRLGTRALAGYGLASAAINVTTAATGFGLGMACDTLVSQTYGGKNLKRVGEVLQRSILILLLFCLPCWAILINTRSILLALWQDPEVAGVAQLYVNTFLPAVPAMFLNQLQMSYLQNQGVILPQMYCAAAANVLNVATNYILLFWLKLGITGSAAANSLSQIFSCILIFCYIRCRRLHEKTWGGWSLASLQEWGAYMKLAIPSTLMICFEWWLYEIGGILAGMLGELDLAAQHVVITLSFITYMFPTGIHSAACVRVGNSLGAGDTATAIITSKVTLTMSAVVALIQGSVLASTKSVAGYIFTSDQQIVALASDVITVYTFLQFFDGLVCVCKGILLGCGRQKLAAVANFIIYYCIGLPIGVSLMFKTHLRVAGMWLGLLICVVILSTFFITVIFRFDWVRMTEEAMVRACKSGQGLAKSATVADPVSGHLVTESSTDTEEKAGIAESGYRYGYTPASRQTDGRTVARITLEVESGSKDSVELSVTQLILRRGLTALGSALLLTAGVVVHLTLPPPAGPTNNSTLNVYNFTSTVQPTVQPSDLLGT